jgi:regulator of sigma D
MNDQNQQPNDINASLSAAQLEKLSLEIENLKRHSSWEDRLVKFLPMIATFVAVAGFFFTVWQAQLNIVHARQEQEKERINKIQNQIRSDKEQILEFITNNKISAVRAAFLIDDLKSLMEQLPQRELETQSITELLSRVAWELRFDEERDINFDVSALRRWPNFRQRWSFNPGAHHGFLARKYYPRMQELHAQNPLCVESMDYDERTFSFISAASNSSCEEGLFPILTYGFREHLEVLKETNNSELLRREIEAFSKLTNNSPLAKKLSTTYLGSPTGQ